MAEIKAQTKKMKGKNYIRHSFVSCEIERHTEENKTTITKRYLGKCIFLLWFIPKGTESEQGCPLVPGHPLPVQSHDAY